MQKIIVVFIFSATSIACSSANYASLQKNVHTRLKDPFYENQFVGLLVYDPEKQDTLYRLNAKKYFTPASNTKIFTLYTALKLLPEKLPALKYLYASDTLFIKGTGDPTLLHPYFKDSTVVHFLKSQGGPIVYIPPYLAIDHFGLGWAWEDYDSPYSVERSALPMYGNVVRIPITDTLAVSPAYFLPQLFPATNGRNRDFSKNNFYIDAQRKDTLEVPFKVSDSLILHLLKEATQKNISLGKRLFDEKMETLYSRAADSVYQRMMYESDNFLAEQILLMASSTLSDTLNGTTAREYMMKHYLADLQQPPKWVDGSGLSRYNLFTPESMVHVLHKMYTDIPRKRLFNLFPVAGVSGTLKTWDNGANEPYIYGKSGSLGNNYCLSGYLITKSGKTLIFSFMNNHFRRPSAEVKAKMQGILEEIRNEY